MRVKVIKQYRDKYTNNLHRIGNKIEVSKERYEEINSTSFGIFVKEIEEETNFEGMTKKELLNHAKGRGISLDTKMTKAEMIKELM